MPDRSDVEAALAELAAGLLYPDGTDAGSAVGAACKVYRGWPVAGALDADIGRGVAHVSVTSVSGTLRDRTRFVAQWQGVVPPPTMAATVGTDLATFSGPGGTGQVAGIGVDGRAYAYRMRAGDSASLVAAALAALIRADRPAVAIESSVHLMSARRLMARVVADGQGGTELRRQESRFRLSCWCPDPGTRDQIAGVVDTGFAAMTFVDVGGWACRLRLAGDSSTDEGSAAGLWRRDLVYAVEFPTVVTQTLPAMLFGIADVNEVDRIE